MATANFCWLLVNILSSIAHYSVCLARNVSCLACHTFCCIKAFIVKDWMCVNQTCCRIELSVKIEIMIRIWIVVWTSFIPLNIFIWWAGHREDILRTWRRYEETLQECDRITYRTGCRCEEAILDFDESKWVESNYYVKSRWHPRIPFYSLRIFCQN